MSTRVLAHHYAADGRLLRIVGADVTPNPSGTGVGVSFDKNFVLGPGETVQIDWPPEPIGGSDAAPT